MGEHAIDALRVIHFPLQGMARVLWPQTLQMIPVGVTWGRIITQTLQAPEPAALTGTLAALLCFSGEDSLASNMVAAFLP